MKRARTISALAVGLVAALVTVAVAQHVTRSMHGHGYGMDMMGEHVGHLIHSLDLNAQQQQQLKTIMANEHTAMKPLFAELAQAHQQAEAAMEAGTLDKTEAISIIDAHKQALAQLMVEHAQAHAQILAILTPDQQNKLKQMQQRRQEHMQKFMQRMNSAPQGATREEAPQGGTPQSNLVQPR